MRRLLALALVVLAVGPPAAAQDQKLKYGPLATPITAAGATDYLRSNLAPDYWGLAPFYVGQTTSSNCSVATAVMAVNAVRGVPALAERPLLTQGSLLDLVGNEVWRAQVVEGGPGTTFAEFASYVKESLIAARVTFLPPVVGQFQDSGPDSLAALRAVLAENELSDDTILLVAFNQGVVTGDWDGPHASPIGAYDATNDRVLILDVDREWYVPYWTDTATLLAAMIKPVSAAHGRLEGDRGGYVLITKGWE